MKFYLGIGLLVAATFAFSLQLALPKSAPAVAMRDGLTWLIDATRPSTTVGAYKLFLRDGESASALSSSEVDALLAAKAAGAPSLITLVGGPDATCSLIRGSGDVPDAFKRACLSGAS